MLNKFYEIFGFEKEDVFLMIDIETIGTIQTSLVPIVSISAIPFTKNEIIEEHSFDMKIDLLNYDILKKSGIDVYGSMETLKWWINQGDNAKKLFISSEDDVTINKALEKLNLYLNQFDFDTLKVYSKSPDFDCNILNLWYMTLFPTKNQLFKYNKTRCVRTVLEENPCNLNEIKMDDIIEHDAHSDNIKQIREIQYAWSVN